MLKKKGIILIFGILLVFTLSFSLVSAENWGYGSGGETSSVSVTTYSGNLTTLAHLMIQIL